MPLVTPDNLAEVLVALGAILSAVGGWTLWKIRKEPPEPGTIDAVRVALAANTKAVDGQTANFSANLQLFRELVRLAEKLHHEAEETRRAVETARDHLAAMRDAINRGKL